MASIALAIVPFLIAELYLRAGHRVDSADLSFDPIFDTAGQTPLFVRSADTTQWMIPESRMNFFRPASFPTEKKKNVRRIFVLGGSTVQGRPYETETAFAKWTELRLKAIDPTHHYEVVNCGGVSYASYRIAIILKEVLSHSPDAIVLYTGHNEYLEERSYNTIAERNSLLQRLAERSALVGSLRRLVHSKKLVPSETSGRQDLSAELRTRLDLIGGMERYVRDDRWRDGVQQHFHDTLDRMIRMCRAANVPLVLCVPTSDIVRTPPMKVQMAAMDQASSQTFESSLRVAQDPDADDPLRIEACNRCLDIDPHHAAAHYIAGVLHWKHQRASKAKLHLTAARDDDVCPLRATSPILESILQLGAQYRLNLIRCDQLFDQTDSQMRPLPDGIEDPQRFVDHIHPTISGHQEIAAAIAQQFIEIFQIPVSASAEETYQTLATEHLSTLDETYYARGKQRLEGLRNWASGRAGKYSVPAE